MEKVYRNAVRGILLTPESKILLIEIEKPDTDFRVWITPGGGIEGDEDPKICLRREIEEETGLTEFSVGPQVWTRSHTFDWDNTEITQDEAYFLIKTDHFVPDTANNPDPVEQSATRQLRWWSIDEIAASDDVFAPRRTAKLLKCLVENGPPDEPYDCGI